MSVNRRALAVKSRQLHTAGSRELLSRGEQIQKAHTKLYCAILLNNVQERLNFSRN